MSAYYYLISSLPPLKPDGKAPMDYATFLQECASAVSESTYRDLEALTVRSDKGPLVKEWASFYRALQDELTHQRRLRMGIHSEAPADRDPQATSLATAALAAKDPLEAEQLLLRAQMEHLDSLTSMHYFDDYSLFGYALKLQLLQRQSRFDKDEGRQEFRSLFQTIQQ